MKSQSFEIPMTRRVAMRHSLQAPQRGSIPVTREKRNYTRFLVTIEPPENAKYMRDLLSVAARASGVIPFFGKMQTYQVPIDMPLQSQDRREVIDALRGLPFVKSVVLTTGGRIR